MIIAGGYYNGRRVLSIPLTQFLVPNQPKPEWQTYGFLPHERQWGPAIGLVGGVPTIATGKNYGDVSIDHVEYDEHWTWDRKRTLQHKREFAIGITVPHSWFPRRCEF